MKRLFTILFLINTLTSLSKAAESVDSIKLGQKVPDVSFAIVKNYPKSKASISDFKGKLIILDFWSTWCTSCIAAIPEMEALQKQFKDKIQVILVTKDKQEKINKLRTDRLRKTTLPMVVGDTVLSKMFIYQTVPTHVWIDEHGILNQKTDGYNTTPENIQAYFKGQALKLALKQDRPDFDYSVPVWMEGDGRQLNHLQYYSFIMNRITDAGHGGIKWERDSATNKIVRIQFLNMPILQMYKLAFEGDTSHLFDPDNRLVLDVKNKWQYLRPAERDKWDDWFAKNIFVYDIKVPSIQSNQVFEYMKEDLDRFFGLHARIEKRDVRCLVLKRITDTDLLHTKGGPAYQGNTSETGDTTIIRNQPFTSSFYSSLLYASRKYPLPVINETHYTGNIDMNINCSITNLPALKQEIKKYGLELIEENRNINMLVITDKGPGQ